MILFAGYAIKTSSEALAWIWQWAMGQWGHGAMGSSLCLTLVECLIYFFNSISELLVLQKLLFSPRDNTAHRTVFQELKFLTDLIQSQSASFPGKIYSYVARFIHLASFCLL